MDDPFVIKDAERFAPAYLGLLEGGRLEERSEQALAELAHCTACPRNCGVNRLEDETRVCHTGRYAKVSSAFAHFGEEDCLRGSRGSGTIFFSFCNLRCVFCQNADISQLGEGREQTGQEIASMMLELQRQGCHNINLVTPEHVVPQVVEAVVLAVKGGLRIPIVYNTSAYDAPASLALLDGIVDIYMPDFKVWERESARAWLKAKDYPERAKEAIREMHRQVGPLRFGPDGVARRGLLVRHLVMPGRSAESEAIFRWLADQVSPDTFVNIMGQYRPAHRVGAPGRDGRPQYVEIGQRTASGELEKAYENARACGLWRFDQRSPERLFHALFRLSE